jgi:hypothetical protein
MKIFKFKYNDVSLPFRCGRSSDGITYYLTYKNRVLLFRK